MTVSRWIAVFSLAGLSISGVFAQFCDKIDQRDADAILGGHSMPLSVGALGCSYSVREKGVRLTLTLSDEGASAKKTFDNIRQQTRSAGWLTGDEQGMGNAAFGELIRRGAKSPTGKCGFVILKGTRIIQIDISDSADVTTRKETLDKLRPIAKKAVDGI